MNLYRYISINQNEEVRFKYIIDVLNQCFGKNYTKYSQGRRWSFNHIDDDTMVWFPKITDNINVKWRNYLINDGKRIIEETNSNSSSKDDSLPRVTFAKVDDSDYKFIGVYIIDESKSFPGHKEYNRVGDYFDLRSYNSEIDNRDVFTRILYREKEERIVFNGHLFESKEDYKRNEFREFHQLLFENVKTETSPADAAKLLKKAVDGTYNLVAVQQRTSFGNKYKDNPNILGELTKNLF